MFIYFPILKCALSVHLLYYETVTQKLIKIPYNLSQSGNYDVREFFVVADFCLCVSLNNLCTLSVQLFSNLEESFVEFAMFSRIFHPRGFLVIFLFSPKISG